MRKALLLSGFLILGLTTLASAHDRGGGHGAPQVHGQPQHEHPHQGYQHPGHGHGGSPQYYGSPPAYGPEPYYDDSDDGYYDDERPGVGIDIPGGPSIRFGF